MEAVKKRHMATPICPKIDTPYMATGGFISIWFPRYRNIQSEQNRSVRKGNVHVRRPGAVINSGHLDLILKLVTKMAVCCATQHGSTTNDLQVTMLNTSHNSTSHVDG